DMVKIIVATAKSGGTVVRRPWFGASLQRLTHEIADTLGLDRPVGALVIDVSANGPAAAAGHQHGDTALPIDVQRVEDAESFGYHFATKPLGGTATLGILRGGKQQTLT